MKKVLKKLLFLFALLFGLFSFSCSSNLEETDDAGGKEGFISEENDSARFGYSGGHLHTGHGPSNH